MDTLNNIIDDLIDHVTIFKELGLRDVRVDRQVVLDLSKKAEHRPRPSTAESVAPQSSLAGKKREPLTEELLRNTPELTPAERQQEMRQIQHEINHCFDCALCSNRSAGLTGQGKLHSPEIMIVGPAPDESDTRNGEVFSGAAGDLLTKMLESIGCRRDDVFLTNMCKCPVPRGRAPAMKEMISCSHFLEDQIRIVRPKVILVMGEHANKGIFHSQRQAAKPQGIWTKYHGIPLIHTFHPKYILRFSDDAEGQQKELKLSVWRTLKAVKQFLGK